MFRRIDDPDDATMREKVLVSWSGGKDSALALHEVQKDQEYEITALLTTLTEDYDRISMHGVRRTLLERQASSLGFPLEEVFISKDASNEEYGSKMREVLESYLAAGVTAVVFGDIFLEDLRKYRERNLAEIGMRAVFPLWKRDTAELARTFVDLGLQAVVTCVDSKVLDRSFVGRSFNRRFVSDLPPSIDPCGENGEFHSFVFDGPIFQEAIPFRKGRTVLRRSRFYYCDLMPG